MANQKKQGSFIMQAGILAAAGIICKIIGILYRSPLAHVIGDEGNGYYSSAYEIYTIILLVSSYSIPSAISKEIAQRPGTSPRTVEAQLRSAYRKLGVNSRDGLREALAEAGLS